MYVNTIFTSVNIRRGKHHLYDDLDNKEQPKGDNNSKTDTIDDDPSKEFTADDLKPQPEEIKDQKSTSEPAFNETTDDTTKSM